MIKIESSKGNINVKTSGKDVDIKTISGNMNLIFEGDALLNQINLSSKSGSIIFNVKADFAYLLKLYNQPKHTARVFC